MLRTRTVGRAMKAALAAALLVVAVIGATSNADARGNCQLYHEAQGCKLKKSQTYGGFLPPTKPAHTGAQVSVVTKAKSFQAVVFNHMAQPPSNGDVCGPATATVGKPARIGHSYNVKGSG